MAAVQSSNSNAQSSAPTGVSDARAIESFGIRLLTATTEANIPVPAHTNNGDEARYPDKSGTYSKGLLQDGIGLVNPAAYHSFKKALKSGKHADFEAILTGGPRTQNGPQGSYAFSLEGTDSGQFGNAPSPGNQEVQVIVRPAPALASAAYGAELVELYWGSLLRDVAFTGYPSDATAIQAAAELNSMPAYAGPKDNAGHVTPQNLFRGGFPGETVGPYTSQFFITPTKFGAQALSQQFDNFLPGLDFMTDATTYQQVQNGISSGQSLQFDSQLRYLRNGRGGAAWTHVDVLYQGYFVALLVLSTMGAPLNPGNPYNHSRTQNGFGTFGGPDFASTVGAVARQAINSVWWQKWLIHLRHRPESGGAIVRQILKGQGHTLQGHVNSNVLNSQAVAASFSKYGDYFLSRHFLRGRPPTPPILPDTAP